MSIQYVSKQEKRELMQVLNVLEREVCLIKEAPPEDCVERVQGLVNKLTLSDIEWRSRPAKAETFPKVKTTLLALRKAMQRNRPSLTVESSEVLLYKIYVCRNYLKCLPEAAIPQ